MTKRRILRFLVYLLPCVVLFMVHYNALRTWFFMDDFAWLGLRMELHKPGDLWSILFQPRAQGTVRTLSERLFFLVFSSAFGMKAGPFHYWVLLTHCGSLVLANAIVRRLTGSALAGCAAAIAWAISPATAVSLSWLSAYNEILCGFLMLGAFYCLIRYVEHGERRFWLLQWAAYLLSFLALEVTVVYPAIALAFVWLAARPYWKKVLWLWVPSLAFTALHLLVIPKDPTPAYKMTFDVWGMLNNLGRYAFKAVGPTDLLQFTDQQPGPLGWWVSVVTAVLLAVFVAIRLHKRDWMPLMAVAWFVFLFGPVLPLQNHFSDYYATIASFGLAMLTGWAFQSAFSSGWLGRVVAVAAASVFVWCEVSQVDLMERWYRTHSGEMHLLLEGIENIAQRRPVETVLLGGIDDELYISGMLDNPFRLYGIQHAYLLPGSEKLIRSVPRAEIKMRIAQEMANNLLADEKTLVAAFDGRVVVDMTGFYRAMVHGEVRLTTLQTNDKVWSSRLGSGWYDVENGFRWMQKRATVNLDVPVNKNVSVVVTVFVAPTLLDPVGGNLDMRAFVDGRPVGVRRLVEGQQDLEFDVIPPELLAGRQVEVALEVSHVVVPPGDGRELGAAVFSIGLRTR